MTIREIAAIYGARKAGKDLWRANCPAHDGHHHGLTIRPGRKCTLLCCRSRGCNIRAILAAKSLTLADTYYCPLSFSPPRKSARQWQAEREEEERERARKRRENTALIRQARIWEAVVGALGKLLAEQPEDGILAFYFDRALEMSRSASREADKLFHPLLRDAPPLYSGSLLGITVLDVGAAIARYLRIKRNS